jgi:dienelactone hydrolase
MRSKRHFVFTACLLVVATQTAWASEPRKVNYPLRGVSQSLLAYDAASPNPETPSVLLLSSDGGWHSFIIEIAERLAAEGYPTIGLDSKEYLSSMSKSKALDPAQVTSDVGAIAHFVKESSGMKSVVLVGWSEGAGLAVLGALDPILRSELRGVVTIGLPELNELAWRWTDSIIYITKAVPNEPTFNSKDYVAKLAPVPLMMIQSINDDFVPVTSARDIFVRAQEPRQIVFINARNHRFEGERDAFWQALHKGLGWFDALAQGPK